VAAIKAHIDDRINWVTSRLDHNRWDENSSGLVHIYRRAVSTNDMVKRLTAEVAALRSAVAQLGAGGNIDYARVEAAAEKAVRDVLGGLDTGA
jgi:hypothetical protein